MSLVVVFSMKTHFMSALYAIRALGREGYDVDLVFTGVNGDRHMVKIGQSSRYIRENVFIPGPDEGTIVELIRRYGNEEEKPVLFPSGDKEVSVIDAYLNQLEPYFVFPHIVNGKPGDFISLMDKSRQYENAVRLGLQAPVQTIVDLHDPENIPKDVVYPCFVKPLRSIDGGKLEMARCDDRDALLKKMKELAAKNPDRKFLVQEFMDIDYEFSVTGACLDKDVYIAGASRKLFTAVHTRGVTILGKIMDLSEMEETIEKLKELMAVFHYYGLFDIDMAMTSKGIMFNEINFRISGIDYGFTQSGSNSAAVLVCGLLKEEGKTYEPARPGAQFFNDRCGWEDYIRGYLTKHQFQKIIHDADYSLMDADDDPTPAKLFRNYMNLKLAKSKVRKILRR